jgi:hypothetical protein
MIELKNSRTIYLGKASGKEIYGLDAFIGAVQMREPEGQWQDIKPLLVRDADGWHIEGAPYYAEIKDDGTRLFCPDRNERGKYLRLPSPALFTGLGRSVVSNPARLDGELLPNQITMPADWGEIRIIFSNTGMHFEVLFTQGPPADIFGKDSPRILLDIEADGLDIGELLKSTSGLGIPGPSLLAWNDNPGKDYNQKRFLNWSYKEGQIELGLDFGTMEFPILLKNTTIDKQVGTGGNDGGRYTGAYGFATGAYGGFNLGYLTNSNYLNCHGFATFTGITIPAGATITTAYLQFYAAGHSGTPQLKIYAVDADNPGSPSNATQFDGEPLTSAAVDWDGAWTDSAWNTSPSIISIIQELVDSYTISNENMVIIIKNDGGTTQRYNWWISYDDNSSEAPKLHIEYAEGGATEKTAAETGSGADARNSLSAAVTKTEAGSGTDARKLMSASLVKAESGNGADTRVSSLASLIKGDTGTGAEQSLLSSLILLLSSDVGSGLDAAVARLAALVKTDGGNGIEGIHGRSLSRGESGSGADARIALLAAIARGESGSGVEQSVLYATIAKLAEETGYGSDSAGLTSVLAALESGSGIDAGWLVGLKNILSGDLGTGYEALKALVGTSGAGSDMKLPGRAGQIRMPSKGVSL